MNSLESFKSLLYYIVFTFLREFLSGFFRCKSFWNNSRVLNVRCALMNSAEHPQANSFPGNNLKAGQKSGLIITISACFLRHASSTPHLVLHGLRESLCRPIQTSFTERNIAIFHR